MTSTSNAVDVSALTKTYGGFAALDGLTMSIPRGAVFGFLGPNGAGKTTTLRILLGLANPTSGTATVLGADVATSPEVRRRIGFAPDVPNFYPWMTGREFLHLAGSLFGMGGAALDARVETLLKLAGLTDVRQKVGAYSRGMKQRLGIAQALVNEPELLLLDEPTSALDPLGRKDVLDMIDRLRGKTTVVFSTHILSDVERVCDSAVIIASGRALRQGSIAELLGETQTTRVLLDVVGDDVEPVLAGCSWVKSVAVTDGGFDVALSDPSAAELQLPRLLAERGWRLRRFEPMSRSLEDVFVELARTKAGA